MILPKTLEDMMKRWLYIFFLILIAVSVNAQQADQESIVGTWTVYQLNELSRYSLNEHQNQQATAPSDTGTITFNDDGTLELTITSLAATQWRFDEGFLFLEAEKQNIFYWPRVLNENVYFLVQVDIVERNERIIALTSRPQGNLIIIREQ